MQDDDEVILNSQPLPVEAAQKEPKKTSRHRKRHRSRVILKKVNQNQENLRKSVSESPKSSAGGETNIDFSKVDKNQINLYYKSDDNESNDIERITMNVHSTAKLLELGNKNDPSFLRKDVPSGIFKSSKGLTSLKCLIETQQLDMVRNISCNDAVVIQQEADDIQDIQFSEWPITTEVLNSLATHETKIVERKSSESLPQEQSNVSSVIETILNDFDDDFGGQTQENYSRTPPLMMLRKRNIRTYKRTRQSEHKKLIFDKDSSDDEPILNDSEYIEQNEHNVTECTQEIDIDLDCSRRIIENIANLSTFFTQSEAFELDFNTSLSQETVQSDDTIQNESPTVAERGKSQHSFLMDAADDSIFADIDSPRTESLKKSRITPQISKLATPLTSKFAMPSTSKAAMASEQRDFLPKRLRFDQLESPRPAEDFPKKQQGFSTAGGKSIQMSSKALKRSAKIFADVDAECHGIEPIIVEMDDKNECDSYQIGTKRICDLERNAVPWNENAFKSAAGGSKINVSQTKSKDSRRLFQEELENMGQEIPKRTIDQVAEKSYQTNFNGFATARGSNINISKKNLERFEKVYKELDVNVAVDSAAGPSSRMSPSPMICKTPLRTTLNRQSKIFATSTPNPNGRDLCDCSAITPIMEVKQNTTNLYQSSKDNSQFFNEWNEDDFDSFFANENDFSQIKTKPTKSANYSSFETSEICTLDVSILRNDVLKVAEEVKAGRQQASAQQQAECLKKPNPIVPRVGALYLEKLLNTKKQLNEMDGSLKKYDYDELKQRGLAENVISTTIENAIKFKFDMWNYYSLELCRTNIVGIDMSDDMKLIMDENSRVGIREFTSAFLQCPSVDPKLVPDNWTTNCLKWIIVKLAAFDRTFSHRSDERYLTPANVLLQMKFRYDREIDRAERSAIHKIVEMDETAAKRMILFVAGIIEDNDKNPRALQLCDGWYAIRTSTLDATLIKAVKSKKIDIGTKLVIQGAELMGSVEGAHPLEMSSAVCLKISANSTRRVKWHAKLGFCRESWPFPISLNSLSESGGLIACMRAFVLCVYPIVYMVKETSGDNTKTFVRSSKMERKHRQSEDHKRLEMTEKFYNEANNEIEKELEAERKRIEAPTKKLCDIENGEDLWKLLEISRDVESFEMDLTLTQKRILNDYQERIFDEKMSRVANIAKDRLNAWAKEMKSTPMLKVRLIDVLSPNSSKTAILTIWNASEESVDIHENSVIEIQKVVAKNMFGRHITINANNASSIREMPSRSQLNYDNFMRRLTPLSQIDPQNFKPQFNELDTIGYVFEIGDSVLGQFQSIFIVNGQKKILCLKCWEGITKYAYDDIVQVGKLLIINHLDWRPQYRTVQNTNIPQAFVTEYTIFTECAKSKKHSMELSKIQDELARRNLDDYIAECKQVLIKDSTTNTVTPLKPTNMNMTMMRTTRELLPNISPLAVPVEERISRLNAYGNLPPPKSIYLGTRQNFRIRGRIRTPQRSAVPSSSYSTSRDKDEDREN